MKILLCLTMLVTAFTSATAHALHDGNSILENCGVYVELHSNRFVEDTQDNAKKVGFCDGLITGWMDAHISHYVSNPTLKTYCFPRKFKQIQVARVIVKYLEANPEQLHKDSTILLHFAFSEAFSCSS